VLSGYPPSVVRSEVVLSIVPVGLAVACWIGLSGCHPRNRAGFHPQPAGQATGEH